MRYLNKNLSVVISMLIILNVFPLISLNVFAENVSNYIDNKVQTIASNSGVIISDQITEIKSGEYKDNTELVSITIPKLVNAIEKNAFSGCENLTEINYGGTRADFAKITIADGNDDILGAKINYTYPAVSEGLSFEWKEFSSSYDGSYRGYFITGIGTCTDAELVLPETYNGEKVIGITANAFMGNENITGVYIPASIQYIHSYAFRDCPNLIWAELHSTINSDNDRENKGYGIFNGCSSLEFLYTNDTEFTYARVNGYPDTFPIGYLFGGGSYDNSTACTQYYSDFNSATSKSVTYYFPNSLKTVHIGGFDFESYTNTGSPFSGCTTIEKIIADTDVLGRSFSGCEGLTEVVFLGTVSSIGDRAFYRCSNLQNITIPSTIKTIGNSVFHNCISLKNITLAKNCKINIIGTNILEGCTAFEAINISDINDWAKISFPDSASNLISNGISLLLNGNIVRNADLQEGITEIGDYAFAGYTELMGVNIPSSLEKIGAGAFKECTSIKKVDVSDLNNWFNINFEDSASNPISISNKMYFNGTLVTNVIIPDEIIEIKNYVFYNYSTLESVKTHDKIVFISPSAFYGCGISEKVNGISYVDSWVVECDFEVTDAIIKNGTTGIADSVFINKNITTVSLPDSLIYIGENAFKGSSLTSVKIPSGVKELKQNTFSDCKYLKNVIFEEGSVLESIGYRAFGGDSDLTKIEIPSSILSIDNDAFIGCNNLIYNQYNNASYIGNNSKPYLYLCSISDTSITTYTIPQQTKIIKNYAFTNCKSITSIIFENNSQILEIGRYTFYGLSSVLTKIDFGDNSNLEAIGDSAFYDFQKLAIVDFGESSKLKTIGENAFKYCGRFGEITIPSTVSYIGDNAFYCYFSNDAKRNIYISDISAWCNISFGNQESNPMSHLNNPTLYLNGSPLTSANIPAGTLEIGDYTFYGCTSLKDVTIPDSVISIGTDAFYGCSALDNVYIKSVEDWLEIKFNSRASNPMVCAENIYVNGNIVAEIHIPQSVTQIPNYAFYNFSSLTSISIPDTVKSVGACAFYGCTNLKEAVLSDNILSIDNDTFYGCSALQSVNIPDSVTEIGYNAFYNCNSLTSISIPDTVKSVGAYAFYGCTNLKEAVLSDNILSIDNYTFYGCSALQSVNIPDSVTEIGYNAFYNCNSLTSISIPDTVKSVGACAFYGCTNLKEAVLSDNILSIDSYTFYGCSLLDSITIPNNVIHIGQSAFNNCTSLKEIFIPASVVTIDSSAFDYCSSLDKVEFAAKSELTGFNSSAFIGCNVSTIVMGEGGVNYHTSGNCLINTDKKALVWGCKNSVIPDDGSVTSINGYAFRGCKGLESIVISEGVTNISNYAFYNCSDLKTVILPVSLTAMPYKYNGNPFYGCADIKIFYCGTEAQWKKVKHYSDYSISGFNYCVHNYGNWTERVEPTCTANGTYGYYKCSKCNKYFDADKNEFSTLVIPALGHRKEVWGEYQPENPIELTNDSEFPFIYNSNTGRYVSTASGCYYTSTFTITALYDCELNLKFNLSDSAYEYIGYEPLILRTGDYSYYYSIGTGGAEWQPETSDRNQTIYLNAGDKLYINFNPNYWDNWYAWFEIVSCVGKAEGYHYVSTDTIETTCTESVVCDICDTVVKQAGHKYQHYSYSDSNCTLNGMREHYKCTTCFKYFDTNYQEVTYNSLLIYAKGHDYGEWIEPIAKTCTTNGQKGHYKCSRCSCYFDESKTRIYSLVISASHNTGSWISALAPTCDTKGYVGHYYCANCDSYLDTNKKLLDTITIPALGHKVYKDNLSEFITISNHTTYPFALNNGVYSSTNKTHSSSSTFTITATKDIIFELQYYTSSESNYDKLTVTQNSTVLVTASGYSSTITWKTCTVNMTVGDTLYITYSKDGSASSGNDTVYFKFASSLVSADEVEPTCKEGVLCDICGTTVKPAKGHSYGEWIAPIAPTCDTDGVLGHYECSDCGKYFNETKQEITSLLDPAAHSLGEWITPIYATCEQEGAMGHYECLGCGKYFNYNREEVETISTEALGHDHSVWVTEMLPTCGQKGYKYSKCPRCEDLLKEVLAATGHNISNGVCSLCGAKTEVVESSHNYSNSVNEEYLIFKEGSLALSLTFSADTKTEKFFDTISIYDGTNKLVGEYSGTELASKTIIIDGDTAKIVLTSDGSVNDYGFKVEIITTYSSCKHTNTKWITDIVPTYESNGHKNKYCVDCDTIVGESDILKAICGDTNHDGVVNASDLVSMRKALLGLESTDVSCDTNGDGETNILDLIRLKKYLVGIDVPLGTTEVPQTQTVELLSQPAYVETKNILS